MTEPNDANGRDRDVRKMISLLIQVILEILRMDR
jgi:hypothetical protein